MKRLLALAAAAALLSGCGILYTDVRGPRAYRTATPNDVKASPSDELVEGKACSRAVLYLVAWGDSGYAAASRDALKSRDGVLYDVKTDVEVQSYLLGLYSRVCTKLTGRVGKL